MTHERELTPDSPVLSPRLRQTLLVALAVMVLATVLSWDLISDALRGSHPQPVTSDTAEPSPRTSPASRSPSAAVVAAGARIFDAQCAPCHGPRADWPITTRLKGRTRDEFYALLDHLPAVNPAMPGFDGDEADRQALAAYLASPR